jgi:NADPH:quinone reductase
MRAIQVRRFGGPEVLELVDLPAPVPGPGELLVDVAVAGVNFRDLLHRAGEFGAELPFVPGVEGAGRVVGVGNGVEKFRPGDRVAWKLGTSYAEQSVVPESETVHVPDELTDEQAAGLLLQGLTAHFLATTTFPIQPGDVALVHAGAGGVGSLLSGIVKLRGGRVIATVSTPAKQAAARAAGAEEVLCYGGGELDVAAAVRELTGGRGVDVVYDGVGRSTFEASLASCRPRGTVALYGGSGGSVPPFDIMRLMHGGSIVLTRPSVRDFTATRAELDQRSKEIFEWVASGMLNLTITGRYRLEQAAAAQEALESRQSIGKIVLVV